ncbi:hypothetical protein D7V97_12255 [Corallococcus sp. CA053C]|uniref:hypothetical protein n=1 Tax=Corallococcus sp. CA053C TaxID=2316732 RepID=UPI000EA11D6A|nr:hypothetical protein [Corallococcus sp. CA053C]RKH11045.1 hypothetical protein D7V97_12255 [Corallococcus sp. CA053C]
METSGTQKGQKSEGTEPLTKRIMTAHDTYFQDLNAVWYEAQQRIQAAQVEYQRALLQAMQPQDNGMKNLQAAAEAFQRVWQEALKELNSSKRFNDAYQKYRTTVQGTLSGMQADALDPVAAMNLAQSMSVVAAYANQLRALP